MLKNWIDWSIKTYKLASVFFITAFGFVMIPILTEAFQHLVEFLLGMFDTNDGIVGNWEKNLRLAAGSLKFLSLMLVSTILPRFFLLEKNLKKALTFSSTAKRTLFLTSLFYITFFIFVFYLAPLLVNKIVDMGVSVTPKLQTFLPLILSLMIFWPFQTKYIGVIAIIFDDAAMTMDEKKKFNSLFGFHFLFVMIATVLPSMTLHYKLNYLAVGADNLKLFAILGLDSVLVGFMACIIGSLIFVLYQAARNRD